MVIFEAGADVGGLGRSLALWGHPVELSAHIFFSEDPFVTALWNEFIGDSVHRDLRRVLFTGSSTIAYPLSPINVARGVPLAGIAKAGIGLVAARARQYVRRSPEPTNAQDWMTQRYGQPLYELFFRDYAEKLFGMPCHELDASFPEFLFASAGATAGADHRHMVPTDGLGSVWQRMADHLVANGAELHCNEQVEAVVADESLVTALRSDQRTITLDGVVSTMPLGRLVQLLQPTAADPLTVTAARSLPARSTVLVYLLARADPSPHDWIALYPRRFRYGRVTDFGPAPSIDDTSRIYCLEAWCDSNDEFWSTPDEDLAAMAASELSSTELFGEVSVRDHHVERVANTHPIPTLGSKAAAASVAAKLAAVSGLAVAGRAASHSVLGLAESMAAARRAADLVLASTKKLPGE